MFERSELQVIIKRIEEPRRFIQVLTGPRQVGKTTLVHQLIEKSTIPCMYENADAIAETSSSWIEQIWNSARIRLGTSSSSELINLLY